jgi:hypothetical protein
MPMLRRKLFLMGTGATALAAAPASGFAAKLTVFADLKNGKFGADLTGTDFRGVLTGLSPASLSGTSLAVANAAPSSATSVVLENLPTVATQGVPGSVGDPGSCEAQSFGYCLGAYTAARNPNGSRKWSAAEAANQPSAAWLYKWQHVQQHKTCPDGSGAVPYARKLVATGCPSAATDPYNPHDATKVAAVCTYINALDTTDPGSGADHFLIGSYKAFGNIKGKESQYLDTFKELIRNGHAIAFSGLVPKQYCIASPPLTNGAFIAPAGFIAGSGHGQVIVGFDDSKGPNGAFLVQNSFGPGWNAGTGEGSNGRIWFGYAQWFASQGLALIEFPNSDAAPSGVQLTASGAGPELFVRESKTYQEGGSSYLMLILHGKDAVNIKTLSVTGPKGLTTTQTLDELLRFGYAYVKRKPAFHHGKYKVNITATTQAGSNVTYHGNVEVT